jgi:hypothetical protein
MKRTILKTAFAVAALAVSLAAYAQPTLFITDGLTTAGPITGGGGSVLYVNPSFGDNWSVVITSGESKPLLGSATSPNMDITIQATSTGPGNNLTIAFSDNGFGPALGSFTALLDSHVVSGSGDAMSFNTYYDAGNALLALTTPLTSSGPLTGNNNGATFPGGSISANPFSLTEVVTLGSGVANGVSYSVNATLRSSSCTGQIGDFVWSDLNGNGCQDAGEPGIPGVVVNLYSGACGTTGTLIATTTTDSTGHYLFSGLCAGTYQVAITTPAGYAATTPNAGCKDTTQPPFTADRDSKCNCAGASPCITCVTLTAANPIDLNVDCGYIPQCSGQIGDFVWNDLNGNGCQDAGEPGIPGVTVNLYSGACGSAGTLVATTTTDSTGHYLFSGLCAGTYQVAITTPAGYAATTPNVGCKDATQPPSTADRDSKCNCGGASPCITCVTLTTANPINLNVDCGYVCNGQIGDFVWLDTNGNGCQDAGEPGIPGVTVNLYSGCGANPPMIATTTTDANGKYLFTNLCAGQYTVSFVTPLGFNRTLAHQSCDGSGNPTPATDSDCTCDNGQPCGICVTLPTAGGSFVDLTIDCGYITSAPSLAIEKTASKVVVKPGEVPTYVYCVTNTGSLEIDNINIVDDNGTPGDPSDDFTVNPAPFNLTPGQSACFAIPHITEPLCMPYGGSNLFIGNLTINVLVNGDVEVFFVQSQGLNDNRYGTNATAATGWSGGHKFSDLTGSDEAEFQFTDGTGKVVLDFSADYISAATSTKFGDGVAITYPSGYGTLGPLGGDGKMISGSSSNVLTVTTSLSDSMNQAPAFYGYTVNSPKETSPLSNVSVPPGWDYTDSYYVKVSHNAFGANGFGTATIAHVHDSPSKIQGIIKFFPTNVCNCVTNVAVATGVAVVGGSAVSVSDNDFEVVCATSSGGGGGGGVCSLAQGAIKFDKNTIQIPIKNNGSANIVMSELQLTWPQATNGKLKTVTLNGPAFNGPSASSPVDLTSANWAPGTNPRTINKGQSKTLVLTFEKNVDKTASHYSGGVVKFGTDASCQLNYLP